MRIRNVQRRAGEEIELQMTPMIDIVFQLLIFFIMTFKIVLPEGDFNIKMPLKAPTAEGTPEPLPEIPPVTIRITALPSGNVDELLFGNRPMGKPGDPDFDDLRQQVKDMVGPDPGPSVLESTEVELDCDYNLNWEYVIKAMTAVSGYVDQGRIVRMVEKISFAQPRSP
jgi:biopolymer transport protein ExbD